jgi:hypothetical protein
MKRNLKIFLIAALLTVAPVLMMAQNPPHPNGGNAPGSGNHAVGQGAPIGTGNIILFTLALAYAGRKMYGMRKTAEE